MIEKDFVNIDDFLSEGIVKWSSPSNIALVKYWGKKNNQIMNRLIYINQNFYLA